ncbi:MAG: hypothetical protein EP307_04930 [Rhodobacteraceae bacterium]|nr:MAG: hypothetical protein EP307_04930 [Paracoccaceae bacterium]
MSVDVRSGQSEHRLYGFATEGERHLFRQLIDVQGVSSTLGLAILSARKPDEVRSAILAGDVALLKGIKGIGPKLEKLCNDLGFYHFDQIAGWTADEVAWVDENLEGFKGRVTRDAWVAQARLLAAGGETEFSKKVDKGDVY